MFRRSHEVRHEVEMGKHLLFYVVFAQVALPLIFVALTVPHAWEIFRSATPSAVASATLFGLGWGIGNVLAELATRCSAWALVCQSCWA